MKECRRRLVLQFVRRKWGPLLSKELRVNECGKAAIKTKDERTVVLDAEGKSEKKQGSGGAVRVGMKGVPTGELASAVSVWSQRVSNLTEYAYFSCQPERKALVHF